MFIYIGCKGAQFELVTNGTPLPKGHGRLIDADALPLNAIDDANHGSNYIKIAHTIIEADKVESNVLEQTCHTCKHYFHGEHDGSCGSYICKGYSNWESEG